METLATERGKESLLPFETVLLHTQPEIFCGTSCCQKPVNLAAHFSRLLPGSSFLETSEGSYCSFLSIINTMTWNIEPEDLQLVSP